MVVRSMIAGHEAKMVGGWWKVLLILIYTTILVSSLVRNCQASNGTSCSLPIITKVNFSNFVSIRNGTNRTLPCEIRSDTSLKGEPIWRRDNTRSLPDGHSVNSSSCSLLTNEICEWSNLTLIYVAQSYDGNYSLTAENDCGNATVYVHVNVIGKL